MYLLKEKLCFDFSFLFLLIFFLFSFFVFCFIETTHDFISMQLRDFFLAVN